MTGYFEVMDSGGARIVLDDMERSILRSLTVQFLEMIGPGEEPADEDADPLARMMREGPTEAPSDPALARLFPDAYGGADQEASSDFRRYTEPDLREGKRGAALAVVSSLDAAPVGEDGSALLELDGERSKQWLGTLNDLRLTLGTRLEVGEDEETLYQLSDSDPNKPLVMAYLWLGGLQETLVQTLMP